VGDAWAIPRLEGHLLGRKGRAQTQGL